MKAIAIILIASVIAYGMFGISSPTEFFTNFLVFFQNMNQKLDTIIEKLSDWFIKFPYDFRHPAPIGGTDT